MVRFKRVGKKRLVPVRRAVTTTTTSPTGEVTTKTVREETPTEKRIRLERLEEQKQAAAEKAEAEVQKAITETTGKETAGEIVRTSRQLSKRTGFQALGITEVLSRASTIKRTPSVQVRPGETAGEAVREARDIERRTGIQVTPELIRTTTEAQIASPGVESSLLLSLEKAEARQAPPEIQRQQVERIAGERDFLGGVSEKLTAFEKKVSPITSTKQFQAASTFVGEKVDPLLVPAGKKVVDVGTESLKFTKFLIEEPFRATGQALDEILLTPERRKFIKEKTVSGAAISPQLRELVTTGRAVKTARKGFGAKFPTLEPLLPRTPGETFTKGGILASEISIIGGAISKLPKLARVGVDIGFAGFGASQVVRGKTPGEKLVGGIVATAGVAGVASRGVARVGRRLTKVELEGRVTQRGTTAGLGKQRAAETIGTFRGEGKIFKEIKLTIPETIKTPTFRRTTTTRVDRGVLGLDKPRIITEEVPFISLKETKLPKRIAGRTVSKRFGEKAVTDVVAEAQFTGISKVDVGIGGEFKLAGQPALFTGRGGGVISGEKGATIFEGLVKIPRSKDVTRFTGARAFEAKVVGEPAITRTPKGEFIFTGSKQRVGRDVSEVLEKTPFEVAGQEGEFLIQSIVKTTRPKTKRIGTFRVEKSQIGDFSSLLQKQLKKSKFTTISADQGAFEIARQTPIVQTFKTRGTEFVSVPSRRLSVPKAKRTVDIVAIPESFEETFRRKGPSVSIGLGKPKRRTRKELEEVFVKFIPKEKTVSIQQVLGVDIGLVPPTRVQIKPRLTRASRVSRFDAPGFTKDITKEAIKSIRLPRKRVISRGIAGAILRPEIKSELKPDFKPEFRQELKPDLKPELKVDLRPSLRQQLRPELRQQLRPDLRQDVKPILRQRTRPRLTTTLLTTPPPVPPPIVPVLFPLLSTKTKKKPSQLKRQFKFAPSLVALEENIRGRKPATLTGIEVRAIPIKVPA